MKNTILASLTMLPFVALVGCKFGTADEGAYCEDTATVLAMDEVSELGFSGNDVLDNLEGERSTVMRYLESGTDTGLTMDVRYDGGEVRFVESVAVYPDHDGIGNTMEAAIDCQDRLEIDVAVTFASGDGVFDEDWDVALRSTDPSAGDFDLADLDPTDFSGTYDFIAFDPAEWDDVWTSVHAGIDAGGLRGTVDEMGEKVEDDGPDGTAMAAMTTVAQWPVEDLQ